jgi:hypothetical protein
MSSLSAWRRAFTQGCQPKERQRPEDALHQQIAEFLRLALPPEVWWSTFPSGGGGAARGGKLKAMGLRAGVPDLLVLHEGRLFGIELKSAKGDVSAEQIDCHRDMVLAGARVAVCRSVDDVGFWLEKWGIPTRARAA